MYAKLIPILIAIIMIASDSVAQNPVWRLLQNSPAAGGSARFEDIFFTDNHTGWIISFGGMSYKTINGGSDWILQNSNIPMSRSIGFFNGTVGILGTLALTVLYRSTNGGLTYLPVQDLPTTELRGICGISIVNENTAYSCGAYHTTGIVIKTTNQGVNWIKVFQDTSKARTLVDCYFWSQDSGIAVGGYNTSTYAGGVAVVVRTTNSGADWQVVHKTDRTGEWCWKISFVARNTGYVSIERPTLMSYILKTTNNGVNWTEIPFRVYDQEGIGFVNESTGWVGGWTGPTYQTTNGGSTWYYAGWGNYVNRIRFINDTLGYAAGDRVYRYSPTPLTIPQISNIAPSEFRLYQNFPNPFNPSTRIRLDIKEKGKYSGKLYNSTGREIAQILNEELEPGSYEITFEIGYQPSGTYFFRLTGKGSDAVIKMISIK